MFRTLIFAPFCFWNLHWLCTHLHLLLIPAWFLRLQCHSSFYFFAVLSVYITMSSLTLIFCLILVLICIDQFEPLLSVRQLCHLRAADFKFFFQTIKRSRVSLRCRCLPGEQPSLDLMWHVFLGLLTTLPFLTIFIILLLGLSMCNLKYLPLQSSNIYFILLGGNAKEKIQIILCLFRMVLL